MTYYIDNLLSEYTTLTTELESIKLPSTPYFQKTQRRYQIAVYIAQSITLGNTVSPKYQNQTQGSLFDQPPTQAIVDRHVKEFNDLQRTYWHLRFKTPSQIAKTDPARRNMQTAATQVANCFA